MNITPARYQAASILLRAVIARLETALQGGTAPPPEWWEDVARDLQHVRSLIR